MRIITIFGAFGQSKRFTPVEWRVPPKPRELTLVVNTGMRADPQGFTLTYFLRSHICICSMTLILLPLPFEVIFIHQRTGASSGGLQRGEPLPFLYLLLYIRTCNVTAMGPYIQMEPLIHLPSLSLEVRDAVVPVLEWKARVQFVCQLCHQLRKITAQGL